MMQKLAQRYKCLTPTIVKSTIVPMVEEQDCRLLGFKLTRNCLSPIERDRENAIIIIHYSTLTPFTERVTFKLWTCHLVEDVAKHR